MVERERLEQIIAALEAQRAMLGEPVVEAALAPLHERPAAIGPVPGRRPAGALGHREKGVHGANVLLPAALRFGS